MVCLRRSQTIDAGDTGDNDDVVSFKKGAGGGVSHLIDFLINQRVLLDIGITGGNIGFRLIVVVIADEEFDRILREELLKLAVELGSQGLVVGDDQRRFLDLLNDIRHGEGLPGSGHSQENLVLRPFLDALA